MSIASSEAKRIGLGSKDLEAYLCLPSLPTKKVESKIELPKHSVNTEKAPASIEKGLMGNASPICPQEYSVTEGEPGQVSPDLTPASTR